jgi:hypothetical protein
MNSSHGRCLIPRYEFMVYISCSEFLKNWFTKPLGPSLGVNRMWTKRLGMTMRQEVDADFFNISPKRAVLGKIKVWPFSCLLLGFTCLHFLLKVSKMWLANLLTSISTKNERFNLNMFNVIYMWHVPCVVTTLNRIFSVWLNLMLVTTLPCSTINFNSLIISVRRFPIAVVLTTLIYNH